MGINYHKTIFSLVYAFIIVIVMSINSFAYIDPNTGGFFFQNITPIVALVFLVFFIIFVYKGILKHFSNKKPMSEQEIHQAQINIKASEQPDGPGAGLKQKSGFGKFIWILIAFGIAYLLISGGIAENFLLTLIPIK